MKDLADIKNDPAHHLTRTATMAAILATTLVLLSGPGIKRAGANDLLAHIELGAPHMVAVGVGGYPDYLGSDDYNIGAVPLIHLPLSGERFVQLLANQLRINLSDNYNWRFGPSGTYRFGRKDVKDERVDRMADIDDSVELGVFASYVKGKKKDFRRQLGISAFVQGDVSHTHDGWLTGLQVFGAHPVSEPVSLLFGLASTFASDNYMETYFSIDTADSLASSLAVFNAGSGIRDVRAWLVMLLHLGPKWHLGAGLMYSRLLGDASDSPIVDQRGSDHQFVFGAGGLYAW